jgi:hypothetical protein
MHLLYAQRYTDGPEAAKRLDLAGEIAGRFNGKRLEWNADERKALLVRREIAEQMDAYPEIRSMLVAILPKTP